MLLIKHDFINICVVKGKNLKQLFHKAKIIVFWNIYLLLTHTIMLNIIKFPNEFVLFVRLIYNYYCYYYYYYFTRKTM